MEGAAYLSQCDNCQVIIPAGKRKINGICVDCIKQQGCALCKGADTYYWRNSQWGVVCNACFARKLRPAEK